MKEGNSNNESFKALSQSFCSSPEQNNAATTSEREENTLSLMNIITINTDH